MPALLPLTFDAVEAPVTPQPYAMSPLTQGYQFSGIAQKIRDNLPPTIVRSDHSIPHIGAYVEYMRSEILHGHQSSYVTCWHGIIAMIGLSRLYGFELSLKMVNMSAIPATVHGRVSSGPVYKRELERLGLLDSGCYYVLVRTVKDQTGPHEYPLAMLDPHILVDPFKTIDERALVNVPWYDRTTHAWKEIDSGFDLAPAVTQARLQTEYCQLAGWLNLLAAGAQNVGAGGLMYHLQNWAAGLLRGAQPPAVNTSHTIEGTAVNAFPGAALSVTTLGRVPDLEVPLVPQFTDRLMLTSAESLSTTTGWNCHVQGEADLMTVVPPLSAEFAALLDAHIDDGRIRLLDIQVEDQFVANHCVKVELIFSDGLLKLSRSRWYTAREIVFAENFPYFAMWPYVNMEPSVWNQYYVYLVRLQGGAADVPSCCASVDAYQSLSFCTSADIRVSSIVPQDKPNPPIGLRFSARFPRFVPLQYVDSLAQVWNCGCLLCQPEETRTQINPGLTAKACIDFGTSNSVCTVAVDGALPVHKVLNGSRVRPLVTLSKENDGTISDFHRYHGISVLSREYKFPSVAQLYVGMNDDPIQSGKIILSESGIINYFSQRSAAITKGETNLSQAGIYTDLKTDSRQALGDVNRAAQMFIKHLMLLCALEARCLQANSIEYYFSYPNEQYRKNLSPLWNAAAAYLDKLGIFRDKIRTESLTERMAASYFVQKLMPDNTRSAATQPGFAVVDIGGGTSDMTVWRRPCGGNDPIFREDADLISTYARIQRKGAEAPAVQGANLSFRYAGNQLFGRTFYTYFKNHPTMLSILFPQIFGLSVNSSGEVIPSSHGSLAADVAAKASVEAVNNYMATLPRVSSYKDPGFPALTALLNNLLEKPGIDLAFWNTPKCAELRSILSFKLKGILYVLGLLVGECAGIHPDNHAGVFNIYLVGGGSQAYRYVERGAFDRAAFDMLAKLPGILFGAYSDVNGLKRRFQLTPPTNGNKVEVVDGMLEYEKDFSQKTSDILAPALGVNEWSRADAILTPELMTELRDSYQVFIDYAVRQDESLGSLLPMLEYIEDEDLRDSQQERVYNHYQATYQNLWSEVNRSLDNNVSTVIREAVFDVMMAEELLS